MTRYALVTETGRRVVGAVQGNAGLLREPHGLERLRLCVLRAKAGQPLSIYEPSPGHVAVYPRLDAQQNGPFVYVDLRRVSDVEVAWPEDAESLNNVLRGLGLMHRPVADVWRSGAHEVCDQAGSVLFTGRAGQVWEWLRETGRWPATDEEARTA